MKKYRGDARANGVGEGDTVPVLSVPDRIGDGDDEPECMDILNADTTLSKRPHRHDIKTLK